MSAAIVDKHSALSARAPAEARSRVRNGRARRFVRSGSTCSTRLRSTSSVTCTTWSARSRKAAPRTRSCAAACPDTATRSGYGRSRSGLVSGRPLRGDPHRDRPVLRAGAPARESAMSTRLCCACCGAALPEPALVAPDRLHGTPGWFSVAICPTCGAGRTLPVVEAAELGRFYPDHYMPHTEDRPGGIAARISAFVRTRQERHAFATPPLDAVGRMPGGRALDVGCGRGDLGASLIARGWSADGIEPAPEACAIARRRGMNVREGTVADAHRAPAPTTSSSSSTHSSTPSIPLKTCVRSRRAAPRRRCRHHRPELRLLAGAAISGALVSPRPAAPPSPLHTPRARVRAAPRRAAGRVGRDDDERRRPRRLAAIRGRGPLAGQRRDAVPGLGRRGRGDRAARPARRWCRPATVTCCTCSRGAPDRRCSATATPASSGARCASPSSTWRSRARCGATPSSRRCSGAICSAAAPTRTPHAFARRAARSRSHCTPTTTSGRCTSCSAARTTEPGVTLAPSLTLARTSALARSTS